MRISQHRRTAKKHNAEAEIAFTYDSNGKLLMQSDGISFLYDHAGIAGMTYDGNTYLYRKNAQGDVIALCDTNGAMVATYTYDAWGNCEVCPTAVIDNNRKSEYNRTVANLNPIRYRSYYFDTETGFYWLQSRFYDPATGRFVSQDEYSYLDPDSVNGINLFAYCNNNPVMLTDSTGNGWWKDFWNSTAGKVIGTILVVAAVIAVSVATAGVGTAVTAALGSGLGAAIVGGAVGGAISGAIMGAGVSIVSQGISTGYANINYRKVANDTLQGAASGALMGAVFAIGGRAFGLIGKTKFAQRPLTNYTGTSKNYMFGSKSGNFTFFRNGKSFRIEASVQHGIHTHYQTVKNGAVIIGNSVPRTTLVNAVWNFIVGTITALIHQSSK